MAWKNIIFEMAGLKWEKYSVPKINAIILLKNVSVGNTTIFIIV